MIFAEACLKITVLFDSKRVAEIDEGVSFETLCERARGKWVSGGRRVKFESKFLHEVVHI